MVKGMGAVSELCERACRTGVLQSRIYRVVLTAFLLSAAGCYSIEPETDFEATVRIYTHARLLLWTYRLTPSSVVVAKHSTRDGREEAVIRHELSDSEKTRLGRFFARFPIDTLEERYANGPVTGNMHYTFDIRISGRRKSVYVYYMKQKELAALAGEIDRLLPRYRMHYSQ